MNALLLRLMPSSRHARSVFGRALVLGLLALISKAASGCLCSTPSPDALLTQALVVFYGSVELSDHRAGRVRFKVLSLYKGLVDGDEVEMTFHPADGINCGGSFTNGTKQLVYGHLAGAKGDRYELSAGGACSQGSHREPATYQAAVDAYRYAIERAKAQATQSPRAIGGWQALAKIQEKHRDYLALLKTLSLLEGLSPRDATIKDRKASALAELGRWDLALTEYQRALDIEPTHQNAKRGKDQALVKLGRPAEVDSTRVDFSNMEFPKVRFLNRDLRKSRFSGATLPDADFSGSNLSAVDFERAVFQKAAFREANLTGARFSHVRASAVDFSKCRLGSANFDGSSLHTVSFREADLQGASFRGAQTYQVDFSGARLARADLSGSVLHMARFDKADLTDIDFRKAQLEGASLVNLRLAGAKLVGARLFQADLSGSDLSGLDLSEAEMQGASLRNAILINSNLRGALLSGPLKGFRDNERLHGPGRPADLRGADLSGARIEGADLRYALFDCDTKWPAGLDPSKEPFIPVSSARCRVVQPRTTLFQRPTQLREISGRFGRERADVRGPRLEKLDLSHADFAGAGFSGFSFWSVDLRQVSFRGTDLRNADFQGSDLRGADFTDANLEGAQFVSVTYDKQTRWPPGFDVDKAGIPGHKAPNYLR